MDRIGIGSAVATCATLIATTASAFEAKWVKADGGASTFFRGWDYSPEATMFFAVAIGVGTASICAKLFADR